VKVAGNSKGVIAAAVSAATRDLAFRRVIMAVDSA
jgi:hypothetical protein